VTQIISLTIINLITPKVGAKHEILFNKPALEAGLLNIQDRLKRHNSVTKIVSVTVMNFVIPKAATKQELTSGLYFCHFRKMEQHIFVFSLIIEGATETLLQFIMPFRSFYYTKLWFQSTKCVFLNTTYREVQTIKNLLIDIIFVMKILFLMTFSELPPIGIS
jgi:hypothetical protein